jgi:hypothetical protein
MTANRLQIAPFSGPRTPLLACTAVCGSRWCGRHFSFIAAMFFAVAFLLGSPQPSQLFAVDDTPAAPPAGPDSAVKSGGDALRSGEEDYPWYDANRDDLRPVVLEQFDDTGKDDTDDNKSPAKMHRGQLSKNAKSSGNGSSDGNDSSSQDDSSSPPPSFNMPEISAPWLIWVAWIIIGGVLVFLAVMLIRAFLNREAKKAKSSDGETVEAEDDSDRLDALPLPAIARPKGTLLEEARRSYEQGDYNTAIVYLYSYQLVKLDQNQWIRLAKGKTNRQYLRELSARGELQSVLARTMIPFEDVYFGNHPLDRTRFEACWNEVERFNRLVERAPA